MNKTVERVLLAAVVLGLFIPGAVRLADPFGTHEHSSSPTIDDSRPPAEMAYDAMMQTERHNYTLTLGLMVDGEWRSNATTTRVDSTHQRVTIQTHIIQYYTVFQNGHTEWLLYTNASTKWSKAVGDDFGLWLQLQSSDFRYKVFRPEPVRNAESNVAVVSRNQSMIVLRMNNDTAISNVISDTHHAASGTYEWNNLTLYIDRDEQVLRRAVFEGRDQIGDESVYSKVAYKFSDWDETTIDRPRWVPYTIEEIVNDLREEGSHYHSKHAHATAQTNSAQVAL